MRILQVIPSVALGFGGPSQAALGLSAALARLGHEVALFTTNADTAGTMDVPLDVPVRQEGFSIRYFPVCLFKNYKYSPSLGRALEEKAGDFDIAHIHSLFQFSTLAASRACRRHRIPYIIRPLGHLDPYALKRRWLLKKAYLELFERRTLDHAARIHFTSQDEMQLARPLRLKAQPLVQGLGLDLDEFALLPARQALSRKYPQLENKKIILFFGRINFKKGLDILVGAFKVLCRQRGDVFLVIAGPDDGYKAKVDGWLSEAGLLGRVIFTGMLCGQEKLEALAAADIFVLPSYSENFGIAVAEAAASGLPVIISRHVGLHEQVMAARAGLVTELDPEALAQAIKSLLDDEGLRQQMGLKAKSLAAEQFGWDPVARRLAEAYTHILAGKLR